MSQATYRGEKIQDTKPWQLNHLDITNRLWTGVEDTTRIEMPQA